MLYSKTKAVLMSFSVLYKNTNYGSLSVQIHLTLVSVSPTSSSAFDPQLSALDRTPRTVTWLGSKLDALFGWQTSRRPPGLVMYGQPTVAALPGVCGGCLGPCFDPWGAPWFSLLRASWLIVVLCLLVVHD